MENRKIEFIGEIPLNKINLFIKLVHNLCKDSALNKLYVFSDDVILSLLNDHVEAIANEDINYIDLENSVRKSVKK